MKSLQWLTSMLYYFVGISHITNSLFSHTHHLLQQCTLPVPKPQISLKHITDWEHNEHNCLTHSYFIWSISVPFRVTHKWVHSALSFQPQLFLGQHAWALQHTYPSTRAEATGDFQRLFQIPPRGTVMVILLHTCHYKVKDQALLFPHKAAHQHRGGTGTIHDQDRAQRGKPRCTSNYKGFICDRIYEF